MRKHLVIPDCQFTKEEILRIAKDEAAQAAITPDESDNSDDSD